MLFNVATKFEILSKIGNVHVFLRQLELMHVCQMTPRPDFCKMYSEMLFCCEIAKAEEAEANERRRMSGGG